jgi:hypothetical protein
MASLEEIRRMIDKDELDYPALAIELGAAALPQLKTLVAEDQPRIAPKAAYLASLIEGEGSIEIIELAAGSRHEVVRVAAAAAAASLPGNQGVKTTLRLLRDLDEGVRIRALKSAEKIADPAFRAKLNEMTNLDPSIHIRTLSSEVVSKLRR